MPTLTWHHASAVIKAAYPPNSTGFRPKGYLKQVVPQTVRVSGRKGGRYRVVLAATPRRSTSSVRSPRRSVAIAVGDMTLQIERRVENTKLSREQRHRESQVDILSETRISRAAIFKNRRLCFHRRSGCVGPHVAPGGPRIGSVHAARVPGIFKTCQLLFSGLCCAYASAALLNNMWNNNTNAILRVDRIGLRGRYSCKLPCLCFEIVFVYIILKLQRPATPIYIHDHDHQHTHYVQPSDTSVVRA